MKRTCVPLDYQCTMIHFSLQYDIYTTIRISYSMSFTILVQQIIAYIQYDFNFQIQTFLMRSLLLKKSYQYHQQQQQNHEAYHYIPKNETAITHAGIINNNDRILGRES